MGPVRLGVGIQWLLDGRVWRVVRQLAPDRLIAQDIQFLVEQEFSQEEILAHYAAGRLRFQSEAVPSTTAQDGASPRAKDRPIRNLSAKEKRILERRWTAIEPLTRLPGPPQEADYRAQAAELRRRHIRCSPRSLRRYYRAWQNAGKDRLALVPRIGQRGGRGRSRRHGLWRRHPQLRTILEEAIHTVYLNKARRPISAVTRRVLEDLQRLNARLAASQAIPVPRSSALARAIARRIAQMDPWEVDRQRWGRKIADSRHAAKRPRQLATRILERVEIRQEAAQIGLRMLPQLRAAQTGDKGSSECLQTIGDPLKYGRADLAVRKHFGFSHFKTSIHRLSPSLKPSVKEGPYTKQLTMVL